MIGRLDEVVVDCVDPATLSAFWAQILGGAPRSRDPDWWSIEPPDAPQISFQRVPEAKVGKNRLHLDVRVDDIPLATQQAEALGAQRVGDVHVGVAGSFQVLLDLEGNEWCLVTPRR